jgi:hypothetical protein
MKTKRKTIRQEIEYLIKERNSDISESDKLFITKLRLSFLSFDSKLIIKTELIDNDLNFLETLSVYDNQSKNQVAVIDYSYEDSEFKITDWFKPFFES